MTSEASKQKKGFDFNPFFILFLVIVCVYAASLFVAPGQYERHVVNGRTLVIPGSYHAVEKADVNVFDIFRSVPEGLIGAANIVFLILIVGGAVEIFNKTGAVPAGVARLVAYSKKREGSDVIVLILLYTLFAILGGFLGFAETAIPFVPLVVPIILALGYDSMVAVGVVFLGCLVGFAVGPTNVYTVGVAHGVAELPMFSGFGLRFAAYVTFCFVGLCHVLWYARKTKKDPSRSLMAGVDISDLKINYSSEEMVFTKSHALSLMVLALSFVVTIYGMQVWKWGINDMSALFLIAGVLAGVLGKVKVDDFIKMFIDGAKGAMGGALVVGVARGIQWILTKTALLDPTINALAVYVEGFSPFGSAVAIFFLILLMDGVISSGSGKAMAIMPIIIPLCDLVGVTRQTATLAYQFGDGIANMGWFTFGTLYIFLSYGKIPLGKWYRFFWPLLVMMAILSIVFLYIAVQINYQ